MVLRDGAVVASSPASEIRHDTMIRMMIGRDLRRSTSPPGAAAARACSRSSALRTAGLSRRTVDLALRPGEILGLAGLVGAGPHRAGPRALRRRPRCSPARCGSTAKPVAIRTPRDAIERGIFLVPEDRKRSGLVLDQSVNENISLPDLMAFASAC